MNAYFLKQRAALALVWLGPLLLVVGLSSPALWSQWHSGRMSELLIISLLTLGASIGLARWSRWQMASVLALVWLALMAGFAGALPVVATVVFALACIALGGMICPRAPLAQQGLIGALVIAGALGWLLQLPLHHAPVYLIGCIVLVAVRHRVLTAALREAKNDWHDAIAGAPRAALFALVMLGLASTTCWLPTVQFDDLAYHVGIPWQLQDHAAYRPDPRLQVWALAPWATDVLQAVPQVMCGYEARGPVNLAWLALMACGVWQLCRSLKANASVAWLSVALVASLPFTASLAGGMQTELPTAAALIWLVVLVSAPPDGSMRFWIQVALLAGGLAAMKIMAAAMAAVLVLWSLQRHPWPGPRRILLVVCIGLGMASSSYVFAYLATGNPVLPLFNGWFGSPYFAATNTLDARWNAGFNAALPWNLTFHTSRYAEAYDGGGGFVLVALMGAWLASFLHRDLRALAWVSGAVLVLPLVPIQYLRYAYPGMVLLIPVAVLASSRAAPTRFAALTVVLCLFNLAFQANSHWLLRTGILKQTVLALGKDAPVFAKYAPERQLATLIRSHAPEGRNVIFLDPGNPLFAELGPRGRSTSRYAPGLSTAAIAADADPSGQAWVSLFAEERVGEIILKASKITPAQRRALEHLRGEQRATVGDTEWWSLPD